MAKARGSGDEAYEEEGDQGGGLGKNVTKDVRLKELGLSCMLNTEVGALLAVMRRPPEPSSQSISTVDDIADTHAILSLKSLRSLIFQPHDEWRTVDPLSYVSPFLNVIQGDEIPAAATALALSAVLKILRLNIFDEKTTGAQDAIHSVVHGITNSRLERTDPASEDAVMMRILQVLLAVMRNPVSVLLTDHCVCTVVNTCFQVVQHSAYRGDMLQKNARHTMHELIQLVFSKLPEIKVECGGNVERSDTKTVGDGRLVAGLTYGAQCMVDIFRFICSLLNVVVECTDGLGPVSWDEDVQLFALVLINSAIELGGEAIGDHPRLLWMIQDELFYHLIYYGVRSSPLFLSMICSTVLNLYHFLRRSLRLQLEAFFRLVLLRIASLGGGTPIQEVAVDGIISFCRQPMFTDEMYVNYDCDPICTNVFEDLGKLLCKIAFPTNSPFSPMQVQAFEGLVTVIGSIANSSDVDHDPAREPDQHQVDSSEFKPFWLEKCNTNDDPKSWVAFVRMRKLMKKRVMIAANHFNRDEKKGLDFLKIAHLVPNPPDPIGLAHFFRYTPGLDKNKIGDHLGDPDEFNIQVLKEFTETFNFCGVILDTALRTYLETFRLPGESQKIQRILEAFSERFHEQQASEIFASKDAVFILCYSLIMLNTDQHNPQVKKKMTEEEFIRNNRAINGGKDLPREYLSELFHSISNNAITLFGQSGVVIDMSPTRWVDLLKRSKSVEPFSLCNLDHKLSRDLFIAISGPSVACLSAIFEQADDEEMLQESMKGLLHIARIAQDELEDILDELLTCFCKFTTLLNPYATPEETLFTFSHDLKPRLATLAVFTIANKYGNSIRGGWRNMVDCLLKLKRLKLLPQSVVEPEATSTASDPTSGPPSHTKSESGVIFPWPQYGLSSAKQNLGLVGQFSQFLSLESNSDSMANIGSEFENNLKLIQQCQIGNIFTSSARLPDDSLLNLGRALIFAAAGKNQKFSTPVEEEETVEFCWELLVTITTSNLNRFPAFWPQFHDYFNLVAQFPLFSPCPFAEKAIVGLFNICVKLLSTRPSIDKLPEELILKSINIMWKLDKEILDTCCESLTESIVRILKEKTGSIQTIMGWKTFIHLLSVAGRHPETYDEAVQALIFLMTDGTCITRYNYAYFVDATFGFAALKISPLENSLKILDLLANSVNWLIKWHSSYSDPGSNASIASNGSTDDGKAGGCGSTYIAANLFLKLAEALRKTSLVRREEIRNHAVSCIRTIFDKATELEFTPSNCIGCFNLVIFAMVDDLHEKTHEYSRRENSEREMRSMEVTLKAAMEMLVDVYMNFMMTLHQSPGFRTFWLGVLRRMDTCMKANFGGGYDGEVTTGLLQVLVPELMKKMITEMKAKEVLVQRDGDELWEITNIQIQWIAPSVKDELFPEDF